MAQDGLIGIGAVSRYVGVGETVKRVKVASPDSIQPCLFDWEANACMVETNESSYAGEIKASGIEGRPGGLGCQCHGLSRIVHECDRAGLASIIDGLKPMAGMDL
jgi:hypothetical protein